MTKQKTLHDSLCSVWDNSELELVDALSELTAVIDASALLPVMTQLRDHADFAFDQLIDVCGVDYLHYGLTQWETDAASSKGFSRAVDCRELDRDVAEKDENPFELAASVSHCVSP